MTARQALDEVAARWNVAAASWNAQALAAIYTADALFFGGRPGHSVGADAIAEYFKSYEGVIRSGRMVWVEPRLRCMAPGCVLSQGYVDFFFELADGQSTQSRLRATLVLVQDQGSWRIAQHHFSPTPEVPPLGQAKLG
ncbi:MAG: SgcJ/EcaC family oxidoreductase [Pseudomonadota bacterium]